MISAEEAGKILREYFANVTPEQFLRDVQEDDPELYAQWEAMAEAEAKGVKLEIEEPTSFPVRINGLTAADLAPAPGVSPKSDCTEPILERAA